MRVYNITRNDMQYIEDFCHSEYYHFNESSEEVILEDRPTVCRSINFWYSSH